MDWTETAPPGGPRPFRRQIEAGKRGEEIARRYLVAHYATVTDVRDDPEWQAQDVDFLVTDLGRVEVKTDFRAHETGNLFIEFDALRKSTADVWLYVVPQRRWLFRFSLDALRDYARLHRDKARTIQNYDEVSGRTWEESGVPIRMSELLLHVPTVLHTGIEGGETGEEKAA